jgi:hypothetical protein
MGRVSSGLAACLWTALLSLAAADAHALEDAQPDSVPAEEDLTAIRSLLDSLADALSASNAEAVEVMLSPSLAAADRNRILSRARAGFQRTAYREFAFPAALDVQLRMTGPGKAKLSTTARFEFAAPSGGASGRGEVPCELQFVRAESGWSVAHTDLFEQLATIRGEAPLSDADKDSIRSLLQRLASAMKSGDAAAIGELLSPKLAAAERSRIISRSRGEFEKTAYPEFDFDLSGELSAETVAADEIRVVVSAAYEYESRVEGGGMADHGEMSYQFRFAKTDAHWGIAGSELFEQFSAVRFEQVLGWLFLGGFLGVLIVFFWAWMALDAWMRTKRLRYGVLLFLSTPVGAALYFFAVYLRRRFMSREE